MHVHILYSHIINFNPLTTKWYLNKMMCLKFCKFSENALYVDTHFLLSPHFCLVLEGEMYQLSHMLTEQKSLMSSMMEMSLVSDRGL